MTDVLPALHAAAAAGDRKAVRARLAAGDPIETRDALGRTVLHLAAAIRSLSMIEILLEKGADVKAVDLSGRSALHHLAQGPAAAGLADPGVAGGHRFVNESTFSLVEAGAPAQLPHPRGR